MKHRLYIEPIVEIFEEQVDVTLTRETRCTTILYVLQGTVDLSYGKIKSYMLTMGDLMLFAPGMRITARLTGPSKAMVLRLNDSVTLCDEYTLEKLYAKQDKTTLSHAHLKSNDIVQTHMDFLAENLVNGLSCVRFLEMNIQELFYYLYAYYSDEDLVRFNLPLLGNDARFMDFIWKNYRQVHNVKHFAELANCSLPGFKSKFKRITGESATQWLSERKARNVYHDINCSQKSLKEISREYHFSSASHMGTFCLKKFGKSPGSLRGIPEPAEKTAESDKDLSGCDTAG